ncbi:MAG: alpha/beta hydrolase [Eubacterium coprostanoligenes]|uniref:Acetyl esterase/lipase n=1 Tax=Eubacterium coprostanoligenes TaxID=290054 RepID=A0A1T4MYG6_9FIRM|nr:alpha/beta hydrolase [Eubacterium coprostanoligenes]MCI7265121.1 alpha/beta hydrolase [Eubacterium coprostanoligenes]SJZ72150.1 Acetyl esterase/lipase [Eubacterium coprostanoligenes]
MAEKVKEKKKHKGLKVLGVIILIIALIVGIGFGVIYYLTKPVDDTSDKAINVGGMLTSQNIDYKEASADGLENDLIVKIMQVSWKFCDKSDKKRMATQTPPENVVKVKDIPYIDDGNPYHKFDVFYPEGKIAKEGLPVIIDIHGGGWMYATKDLNEYYCMELAKKGYCVFSISYRLVPDVTVNEQIKDCTEALAFIRANMKDYPANKKTVMLTGDSAGGQLALYSTILNNNPDAREIFGTVDTKLNIKCLLLTSPVTYAKSGGWFSIYTKKMWGKDYKTKSTYNYMDLNEIMELANDMPPTYFITSSGDTLAHDQTVNAYNYFVEKGYECEIEDFTDLRDGKKLPHVFSVLDPFDEYGQKAIDNALDYYQKSLLK